MICRLAAVAVVMAWVSPAQTADVEKAFADFQRSWTTQDRTAAEKLICDELVWVSIGGRVLDKQEVLQTLSRRGGVENLQDKKVRLYGDAAVIAFADGAPGGTAKARRTIVWNKTAEGWKVVSFHTSPAQ